MVLKLMTVRPRDSFSSFKNNAKAAKLALPKRMPSFIRVNGLNNFYLSIDGEEYEFVNGVFFKKVTTLSAGESFG